MRIDLFAVDFFAAAAADGVVVAAAAVTGAVVAAVEPIDDCSAVVELPMIGCPAAVAAGQPIAVASTAVASQVPPAP